MPDERLGRRPRGQRHDTGHGAPARQAAAGVRGGRDRLLSAPRALGQGRCRPRDAGRAARGFPACRRSRRDGACGPRDASLLLPGRARARPGRGPLVVRRPGGGRARRMASGARARRRDRVPEPHGGGVPRARRARPRAPGARRRGRASTWCPTAPRCGRGCSTCATRSSARRSTTFARSPPDVLAHAAADRRRRLDQPRPRRPRRAAAGGGGDRGRRDVQPRAGRQGREPGGRVRAARRRGDDDRRGRARRSGRRGARRPPCGRRGDPAAARRDAPTGVALIQVDAEGETTIAVAPGANATLGAVELPPHDAVLCQLEIPDEAVLVGLGGVHRPLLPERRSGAAASRSTPTLPSSTVTSSRRSSGATASSR